MMARLIPQKFTKCRLPLSLSLGMPEKHTKAKFCEFALPSFLPYNNNNNTEIGLEHFRVGGGVRGE